MKKTDQSGHSMISHTTRQTALCKLYLIALFFCGKSLKQARFLYINFITCVCGL